MDDPNIIPNSTGVVDQKGKMTSVSPSKRTIVLGVVNTTGMKSTNVNRKRRWDQPPEEVNETPCVKKVHLSECPVRETESPETACINPIIDRINEHNSDLSNQCDILYSNESEASLGQLSHSEHEPNEGSAMSVDQHPDAVSDRLSPPLEDSSKVISCSEQNDCESKVPIVPVVQFSDSVCDKKVNSCSPELRLATASTPHDIDSNSKSVSQKQKVVSSDKNKSSTVISHQSEELRRIMFSYDESSSDSDISDNNIASSDIDISEKRVNEVPESHKNIDNRSVPVPSSQSCDSVSENVVATSQQLPSTDISDSIDVDPEVSKGSHPDIELQSNETVAFKVNNLVSDSSSFNEESELESHDNIPCKKDTELNEQEIGGDENSKLLVNLPCASESDNILSNLDSSNLKQPSDKEHKSSELSSTNIQQRITSNNSELKQNYALDSGDRFSDQGNLQTNKTILEAESTDENDSSLSIEPAKSNVNFNSELDEQSQHSISSFELVKDLAGQEGTAEEDDSVAKNNQNACERDFIVTDSDAQIDRTILNEKDYNPECKSDSSEVLDSKTDFHHRLQVQKDMASPAEESVGMDERPKGPEETENKIQTDTQVTHDSLQDFHTGSIKHNAVEMNDSSIDSIECNNLKSDVQEVIHKSKCSSSPSEEEDVLKSDSTLHKYPSTLIERTDAVNIPLYNSLNENDNIVQEHKCIDQEKSDDISPLNNNILSAESKEQVVEMPPVVETSESNFQAEEFKNDLENINEVEEMKNQSNLCVDEQQSSEVSTSKSCQEQNDEQSLNVQLANEINISKRSCQQKEEHSFDVSTSSIDVSTSNNIDPEVMEVIFGSSDQSRISDHTLDDECLSAPSAFDSDSNTEASICLVEPKSSVEYKQDSMKDVSEEKSDASYPIEKEALKEIESTTTEEIISKAKVSEENVQSSNNFTSDQMDISNVSDNLNGQTTGKTIGSEENLANELTNSIATVEPEKQLDKTEDRITDSSEVDIYQSTKSKLEKVFHTSADSEKPLENMLVSTEPEKLDEGMIEEINQPSEDKINESSEDATCHLTKNKLFDICTDDTRKSPENFLESTELEKVDEEMVEDIQPSGVKTAIEEIIEPSENELLDSPNEELENVCEAVAETAGSTGFDNTEKSPENVLESNVPGKVEEGVTEDLIQSTCNTVLETTTVESGKHADIADSKIIESSEKELLKTGNNKLEKIHEAIEETVESSDNIKFDNVDCKSEILIESAKSPDNFSIETVTSVSEKSINEDFGKSIKSSQDQLFESTKSEAENIDGEEVIDSFENIVSDKEVEEETIILSDVIETEKIHDTKEVGDKTFEEVAVSGNIESEAVISESENALHESSTSPVKEVISLESDKKEAESENIDPVHICDTADVPDKQGKVLFKVISPSIPSNIFESKSDDVDTDILQSLPEDSNDISVHLQSGDSDLKNSEESDLQEEVTLSANISETVTTKTPVDDQKTTVFLSESVEIQETPEDPSSFPAFEEPMDIADSVTLLSEEAELEPVESSLVTIEDEVLIDESKSSDIEIATGVNSPLETEISFEPIVNSVADDANKNLTEEIESYDVVEEVVTCESPESDKILENELEDIIDDEDDDDNVRSPSLASEETLETVHESVANSDQLEAVIENDTSDLKESDIDNQNEVFIESEVCVKTERFPENEVMLNSISKEFPSRKRESESTLNSIIKTEVSFLDRDMEIEEESSDDLPPEIKKRKLAYDPGESSFSAVINTVKSDSNVLKGNISSDIPLLKTVSSPVKHERIEETEDLDITAHPVDADVSGSRFEPITLKLYKDNLSIKTEGLESPKMNMSPKLSSELQRQLSPHAKPTESTSSMSPQTKQLEFTLKISKDVNTNKTKATMSPKSHMSPNSSWKLESGSLSPGGPVESALNPLKLNISKPASPILTKNTSAFDKIKIKEEIEDDNMHLPKQSIEIGSVLKKIMESEKPEIKTESSILEQALCSSASETTPNSLLSKKRGRPRKIVLPSSESEVNPLNNSSITSLESPSLDTSGELTDPSSSRQVRSCRARTQPIVVKTRKPRGGGVGRGGGRGGAKGVARPITSEKEAEKIQEKLSEYEKAELAKIEARKEKLRLDRIAKNEAKKAKKLAKKLKDEERRKRIAAEKAEKAAAAAPQVFEEETRMSAPGSRGHTPAPASAMSRLNQTSETPEESQNSTPNNANKKGRMEIPIDPESDEVRVDQLAEYQWQGSELCMIQEQVSLYLGVKSFKRKYPDLKRRLVEAEERTFLEDSGLVPKSMCDLGLTAVSSAEVLDVMYHDFPDKYEEFRGYMREKESRELSFKQKALSTVKGPDKSKGEPREQALEAAAMWNLNLNRERREERRCSLDLQTFTVHFPKTMRDKMVRPALRPGLYPVPVIPGQFSDYYKTYTPTELMYFPLNTVMYGPLKPNERRPNHSDGSDSSSSSSDDSSGSSSCGSDSEDEEGVSKDCKICNGEKKTNTEILPEILLQCSQCKGLCHPTCQEITPEMLPHIKKYSWHCSNCKKCVQCKNATKEDKMLFCDLCDRGYHISCVGLKKSPESRWHCSVCSFCTICGSKDPGGAEWHYEYKKTDKGVRLYQRTLCVPCSKNALL